MSSGNINNKIEQTTEKAIDVLDGVLDRTKNSSRNPVLGELTELATLGSVATELASTVEKLQAVGV